ncbi:histidine kinase [Aliiglaciecola sp. CAU 1673]|uniref:sensor histidine kinase n=1 Tax=Aliiglaciecola sp. CAU 1673 TaxID=3032595 RepID=UPI0023DBD50A|nr:histidine kinase [Aliiglaciecola sp. CAU 1673]MDF2179857.1 histidine kinase [Aliiglaciecola sp. CAU 1673]
MHRNIAFRQFIWVQLLLWTAMVLLTRFTWLDVYPPSWLWIVCYMFLGALYSSLLALCFVAIRSWPIVSQLLLAFVLSVVLGLLWRASFNALEYHVLESANNQFRFWGYFHNGKSAVMQLLLWSCGYWLWQNHQRLDRQLRKQELLRQQARDAKLKLLQLQIDPHFLFNVLANVDTLLLKQDPVSARTMLSKLSAFLRQTLSLDPPLSQSLEKELQRSRHYLEIEKLRFGDKLRLDWQLPEPLPDIALPTGLLLPLMENAIKHGVAVKGSEINISIQVEQMADCTRISVSNPSENTDEVREGMGMGLANTGQRLQTFFGDRARLDCRHQEGKHIATISIMDSPCH